jgi:hypothetical protein
MVQVLFKNLFNLISFSELSFCAVSENIILKSSITGALRYQNMDSFTTTAPSFFYSERHVFCRVKNA